MTDGLFTWSKTLRGRFTVAMVATLARTGCLFLTSVLLARLLSPAGFGDFNFLVTTFAALLTLLDCGTSAAFFTFASRTPPSRMLLRLYGCWLLSQPLFVSLFVLLVPTSTVDRLWLGHDRQLLLLAVWGVFFATPFLQFALQLGESCRDTVFAQATNLLTAVLQLCSLASLGYFELLSLENVFIVNSTVIFAVASAYLLRLRPRLPLATESESPQAIAKKFVDYCLPLIWLSMLGVIFTFFDSWILQLNGGSEEQGYYAAAFRFSYFPIVVGNSLLQIFWKEMAAAHQGNDYDRMAQLYRRVTRGSYFFATLFAALLLPFTETLVTLVFGESYRGAVIPTMIMFLYPLHNFLHNFADLILLATGNSRLKSFVGTSFFALSLILSLTLVAQFAWFPFSFGLGATGMALKMVLAQLFAATLMGILASRVLRRKFEWSFQFWYLAILAPVSLGSSQFIRSVFGSPDQISSLIMQLGLHGLVLAGVATLIWRGEERLRG